MDYDVPNPFQPHSPMVAEPQRGSLAHGIGSPQPQHGDAAQGDSAGNVSGGNAGSSKQKRRLFGNFGFRSCAKPEPNDSAEPGAQSGEPPAQNIQLVPIIKITPPEQTETVSSGPTVGIPAAAHTRVPRQNLRFDVPAHPGSQQGSQQGQFLSQAQPQPQQQQQQPQGRQAQHLTPARAGPTQAEGSDNSEYSSRGGATGDCLSEPCGCCSYWCHKIFCDDD
ncbi:hypothetical protein Daesc_007602 [Daldinia eschscholtzii]|uniref:Uncharacterized protein n=1 Tax=Daldinia eschscholtzii TaxID=292717 RepID=A0AAX6MF52_9PEZI